MKTVRLVLALHNHQPVGNLDEVVHRAMEDAYLPFLTVMEQYPSIPFTLHTSGCLFEWVEAHAPEYLDRVGALARQGRVEIMGGGVGEPIFTMLPDRDTVGQIRSYAGLLKERLGVRPAGAWLPERVWEQQLVRVFAEAGASYTVVDDFHMKRAGVEGTDLFNVFLTEDRGATLCLFPSCETLRYLVPFREPAETVAFLRSVASDTEDRLVVYADDGEKFGTWPGTKKHVYEDGWLKRFFDLLEANRDWIRLTTLQGAFEAMDRPARIYVPDSSYREMLEWSLPARRLARLRALEERLGKANLLDGVRPFLGGGFWRNFKVKYPETSSLYARMMEASGFVDTLPEGPGKETARRELYRGQCNCSYWHGVFGGLYLPHLRFAAYRHLLGAEREARRAGAPAAAPVAVRDLDFDGRNEVVLAAGDAKVYLKPHAGGAIYELDLLDAGTNPLGTMTRRFEDYHKDVGEGSDPGDAIRTIHDRRPTKGKGVKEGLVYDAYARAGAVDHFFGPSLSLGAFDRAEAPESGGFASGAYALDSTGPGREPRAVLTRRAAVRAENRTVPVSLTKTVSLDAAGEILTVAWSVAPGEGLCTRFGSEFNFALLSGSSFDRYYYGADRRQIGPLGIAKEMTAVPFLGLVDEWQGLRLELAFEPAANLYVVPVKTVSQSEGGFELLYQQSCVLPWWALEASPDAPFEARVAIRMIREKRL